MRTAAAAFATAVLAAASLAVVVTASAAGAPRPAPGLWEAATPDGFLRFRVVGGTVRDLVVSYRCEAEGATLWSGFVPLPIRDGSIAVDGFTSLEATFRDMRRARGSVAPNPGIGLTECRNRGDRAFSARKLARAPIAPALGQWEGTDANGAPVSFTVDARGLVQGFRSGLTTDCALRRAPTPFGTDAVVRPSTATFAARSRPVDFATKRFSGRGQDVDGSFRSARLARGTVREFDRDRGCDSGPVAWTARPR